MTKSKDGGYEYILSNQVLQLPIIRYYQKMKMGRIKL